MDYQVFDYLNEKVELGGFDSRERAKEYRDSVNKEYYGENHYNSIVLKDKEHLPRYIVTRGEGHPKGPSYGPEGFKNKSKIAKQPEQQKESKKKKKKKDE